MSSVHSARKCAYLSARTHEYVQLWFMHHCVDSINGFMSCLLVHISVHGDFIFGIAVSYLLIYKVDMGMYYSVHNHEILVREIIN